MRMDIIEIRDKPGDPGTKGRAHCEIKIIKEFSNDDSVEGTWDVFPAGVSLTLVGDAVERYLNEKGGIDFNRRDIMVYADDARQSSGEWVCDIF